MRYWGYFLIALGVGALCNLKSGADAAQNISYIGMAIAMFGSGALLVWRGQKTGKTSVQGASTADGDLALPMTPPVFGVLKRAVAKKNRPLLIAAAGVFLLGVVLGVVLYLANSSTATWLIWLGAAFGGAIDVYILLVWIFVSAPGRRDLREGTYLRTSGPMRVDSANLVLLGGHTFAIDPIRVAPRLQGLDWASVDHSRHMHVIFEIRNRYGAIVYRAEGYPV